METELNGFEESVIETEKIIPLCKFRPAKLEDIFYMLHNAAEHRMFHGVIFKVYPELKVQLAEGEGEDERKRITKEFFTKELEEHKEEIQGSAEAFQEEWGKIETKALRTLSEICEQDWTEREEKVAVNVSVNPINPRNLQGRTFDIYYRKNPTEIHPTMVHEMLHFIWFEKFGELFPEVPESEYNGEQNLAWHLSEVVPGIVLNDERMQQVFEHEHTSYKCYYEAQIDGKSLMTHMQALYDGRADFADFIHKAWNFVQEHKKEVLALSMRG